MTLNRPVKVAIGLATLVVAGIPILFLLLFSSVFFVSDIPGSAVEGFVRFFFDSINYLFVAVCILNLLIFGLVSFYVVHTVKNDSANQVVRILLALALFFFPYIAMPAYFLIYIWPTTPPSWAVAEHTHASVDKR